MPTRTLPPRSVTPPHLRRCTCKHQQASIIHDTLPLYIAHAHASTYMKRWGAMGWRVSHASHAFRCLLPPPIKVSMARGTWAFGKGEVAGGWRGERRLEGCEDGGQDCLERLLFLASGSSCLACPFALAHTLVRWGKGIKAYSPAHTGTQNTGPAHAYKDDKEPAVRTQRAREIEHTHTHTHTHTRTGKEERERGTKKGHRHRCVATPTGGRWPQQQV